MVMNYTIETMPIDDRITRLIVTFENGFRAETTVIGDADKARWYAEQAFIPDLMLAYPELRGEEDQWQ